jgi:tRNA(adenine34) deaminase
MCAGAIVHTRLKRVVFGIGDPKGGAAGGAMNILKFPTLNHQCEITPGVMQEDCRSMLRAFFAEVRQKKESPQTPASGEIEPLQ